MTGKIRRRKLPHWDVIDGTYFLTACLDGSIPARGLRELSDYRDSLEVRPAPSNMSAAEWKLTKQKLIFGRLDRVLDNQPAVQHFANPKLAKIIQESIYYFAEERYHVLAYVVMPSHLHWVFRPIDDETPSLRTPREAIVHSLKSYTSNQCNLVLNRRGKFWQDEAYDHWVRNEEELLRIIAYVEQNPVKAGLVEFAPDYRWSSAYDRLCFGIPMGEPLIPTVGL